MSKVICERNDIVAIADAVRNKTGSTDQMTLGGIVTEINSITGSNNGPDTSDATATANEIFKDKTAYVANGKVTGTFTIDDELTEQNELISQISTLVQTKANPPVGGEDVTEETNAYTDKIASLESAVTALETELQGKASGGNGSVETCTVTITNPRSWTAFYNSLENNSIIGKLEPLYYGSSAGTATITAIQGSVVVFIEAVNIGTGIEFGMENCSVSNEGIVLGSIRDAIELKTCAIAIQLPKTSACTITFS